MKAFDVSKFTKSVTKAIPGMSVGFNDPSTWISTGCYALDYRISGRFKGGGIPLNKVSMLAGETGSGKSFLVSGNMVKNAQDQGIYVFLIDTENALDESWLGNLKVCTTQDKLTKFNMSLIEDVSKLFFDFVKSYKSDYGSLSYEDRPKVLWVIDSLGMLDTSGAAEKIKDGDMRGDMGIKAKQLKAMITQMTSAIAMDPIGVVCTNHVYSAQSMYAEDTISGGSGPVYAASIVVTMQKFKLKEDDAGAKITDVTGIRSKCRVAKTRYNKPFEDVEIKIPYETGMDPFSGLFEMFKKSEIITKVGNRWKYVNIDTNEEYVAFEKKYNRNDLGILDLMMQQYNRHPNVVKQPSVIVDENDSEEESGE